MAIAVSQWDLDCRKCTPEQKADHGFCSDSPIPKKWQIGDWTFQRCPLTLVTQQSVEYLNAYPDYKKGVLPNGPGWMDETEKFMQAMRIIDREVKLMEKRQNG